MAHGSIRVEASRPQTQLNLMTRCPIQAQTFPPSPLQPHTRTTYPDPSALLRWDASRPYRDRHRAPAGDQAPRMTTLRGGQSARLATRSSCRCTSTSRLSHRVRAPVDRPVRRIDGVVLATSQIRLVTAPGSAPLARHGLTADQVCFTGQAVEAVIRGYTREAGVRGLTGVLGAVCAKVVCRRAEGDEAPVEVTPHTVAAMLGAPPHDGTEIATHGGRPGVAVGLCATADGVGDVRVVEASRMAGSGEITLTGRQGEVMQEAARTALSWLRANAGRCGLDPAFHGDTDVHLHLPSGDLSKEGASAGLTVVVALVSACTGRAVRGGLAMTGEITLSGHVLPVGGNPGESAGRASLRTLPRHPAAAEPGAGPGGPRRRPPARGRSGQRSRLAGGGARRGCRNGPPAAALARLLDETSQAGIRRVRLLGKDARPPPPTPTCAVSPRTLVHGRHSLRPSSLPFRREGVSVPDARCPQGYDYLSGGETPTCRGMSRARMARLLRGIR